MSGFAADWLALREPHDARARNAAVLKAVAARFAGRADLAVIDLACGRGSTLRAIAPHLPAQQHWRLIDHDAALLAEAAGAAVPSGVSVTMVPLDLASDLDAALAEPAALVTASALLDLVSAAWIDRLVALARSNGSAVYVALSYDGRVALAPAEAQDAAVVAAVNAHQKGDKGFGPALGPAAAAYAIERFKAAGFDVVTGRSDWILDADDGALQTAMFAGWAKAAREIGKVPGDDIDAWLAARQRLLAAGRATMGVGHVDFFASPR
jgi:hypothetical protein